MELDALKAFVTVAKTESFSDAAKVLFLTQPAVSKRIAALEDELGTPLFDRIGRNISLTLAGKTLFERAETILREVQAARRAMDDLAGEVKGELKVATSHHIGLHKLPPLLRHFAQNYSGVNLQFEFLDSEIALDKVLAGECEMAVITVADKMPKHLMCETLWLDPLVFVTHFQSDLPEQINLETLSQEPAILPDLNTYTGRIVKHCFDHHRLELKLNMATNYLETIKMMVSVGLGWSVLPLSMVDNQLKILQVANVKLSRNLGVVRHEKRHLSNAAQAFYAMLLANKGEQGEVQYSPGSTYKN